jgi:hypothetical protein
VACGTTRKRCMLHIACIIFDIQVLLKCCLRRCIYTASTTALTKALTRSRPLSTPGSSSIHSSIVNTSTAHTGLSHKMTLRCSVLSRPSADANSMDHLHHLHVQLP